MRLAMLSAALLAAAPALALKAGEPLPYTISAPKDAAYSLRCQFRKIEIKGKLGMKKIVNSLDLSGEGPKAGRLPTDNARCRLKQTGGRGPVTLTLVKDKTYTATVAGPGAAAQVFVF